MSIRPLDMQVILAKSADVTKVNTTLANNPNAGQQAFSTIMQKQSEESNKQVSQNEFVEQSTINKDGKNATEEDKKKKKKKKTNGNNKSNISKGKLNRSTSMYDISL